MGNGYLRSAASPFPSSVESSYTGFVPRPPASATSLRFQEPSELGMSLEGSLSQLRASFTAAGGGGHSAAPSADASSSNHLADAGTTAAVSASTSVTSSDTLPQSKDGFKIKIAPSALTRRVSPHIVGGMLRCDDSLINLAMLPTLDSATSTSCVNAVATPSAEITGNSANVNHCDYMAPTSTTVSTSNNDSRVNLATAVGMIGERAVVPSFDIAPSFPCDPRANPAVAVDIMGSEASSKCVIAPTSSTVDSGPRQSEISRTGEGSSETFSFIDFQ